MLPNPRQIFLFLLPQTGCPGLGQPAHACFPALVCLRLLPRQWFDTGSCIHLFGSTWLSNSELYTGVVCLLPARSDPCSGAICFSTNAWVALLCCWYRTVWLVGLTQQETAATHAFFGCTLSTDCSLLVHTITEALAVACKASSLRLLETATTPLAAKLLDAWSHRLQSLLHCHAALSSRCW